MSGTTRAAIATTFYGGGAVISRGGFPFQNEQDTFESVGLGREGGGPRTDVLSTREAVLDVFPHNLGYFVFGRHTGFAIYFFPGVMAVLLFLLGDARSGDVAVADVCRRAWDRRSCCCSTCRSRTRAAAARSAIAISSAVTAFLFLVPPLQTAVQQPRREASAHCLSRRSCRIRSLRRFHPYEHSKTGLYRWLPTELTMVNDLPVNTAARLGCVSRLAAHRRCSRISSTTTSTTAKAMRSGCAASRAPICCCARRSYRDRRGRCQGRSLHIAQADGILETGPKPNRVVISTGGDRRIIDMAPSSQQTVDWRCRTACRTKYDPVSDQLRVHLSTISSSSGFVPMFENGANDSRFLGVMVRLVPTYGAAQ